MERVIKIGLVGAGMFGGDVHLRAYADLVRVGLSPQLGRVGLDDYAREFAPVRFELAGIATRTEASAIRARDAFQQRTGKSPDVFFGDRPWEALLQAHRDLDVLAVATPDHLHTQVILAGLAANAHVITEKPMCLDIAEADQILEAARARNRIVAVDMHKRYDPDHLRVRDDIRKRIGEPLYGSAFLEEPLQVSTATFKWAEDSDPFTYVGSHWIDLMWHYFHSKPVSLTAVGQKKRLRQQGIDAYDAVQVRVDYANGMSIYYHNNWITPPDFEGPVNQGHEIVGTRGKVESDQQYRGFRWWEENGGSRTANNHFTREVPRPDGSSGYVGYGVDSLTAGLCAICRCKFLGASLADVAAQYPTAEDARIVTAILHAARIVRDRNFHYLSQNQGAPVTARFDAEGIAILDPLKQGPSACERVYGRAV